MKKTAILAAMGTALTLAACGDTTDASTEAMPDTVEMPAEEALAPIEAEPVEAGPEAAAPVDPTETAPDPVTTNEAADAAADVAAEAQAAIDAAEAAAAVEE
ncbi:hypothetical protein [Qipengyuania nanhaisediminis]|uniref:hypothetical protein n=1 Tax=Qipengyuania nanhaisediminis TaxID=604088 RepID=UPI0038B318FE